MKQRFFTLLLAAFLAVGSVSVASATGNRPPQHPPSERDVTANLNNLQAHQQQGQVAVGTGGTGIGYGGTGVGYGGTGYGSAYTGSSTSSAQTGSVTVGPVGSPTSSSSASTGPVTANPTATSNGNTVTIGPVTTSANGGQGGAGGNGYGGQGGNSTSSATGGQGGSATGGSVGPVAATSQGGQGGAGGNASNTGNAQSTTVNVGGDNHPRAPVSSAYAPMGAYGGSDICDVPVGIGGQGVVIGISAGFTVTDSDCVRRKNSRELAGAGYKDAAVALLCKNDETREAMRVAGTPCPQDKAEAAKKVADAAASASSKQLSEAGSNGGSGRGTQQIAQAPERSDYSFPSVR